MDRLPGHRKPLELVPMEEPAPKAEAAPESPPPRKEPAKPVDPHVVKATREFAHGLVNQPLWVRILDQAGGDKSAAKSAYLRARAAELRIAGHGALPSAEIVHIGSAARARVAPPEPPKAAPPRADPKRKLVYLAAAGAALIVIVVVAVSWMMGRRETETPRQPVKAAMPKPSAAQTNNAQAADNATSAQDPQANLEAKVRELAEAGNWNVFVLYALEWTQKEPANVAAWTQLAIGYTKLGQLNEAVHAATKAAQLAPDDPLVWRHVGRISVASKDLPAALQAFERAAALDEKDADTLVQTGIVNARLERLPQAKSAFDKVLATNPGNVEALCGQVWVAQKQSRPKDGEAFAQQLKSLGATCSDWNEPASATVTVRRSPSGAPVPATRR